MVVVGGSTNQKDLTVPNGVTYTVSIQTLSSTELPSDVVEVPYQSRAGQVLVHHCPCRRARGCYFNHLVCLHVRKISVDVSLQMRSTPTVKLCTVD